MIRRELLIYMAVLGVAMAATVVIAGTDELDLASVRVGELTFSELFASLSPENVVILTSLAEFRELVRLAAVDNAFSP